MELAFRQTQKFVFKNKKRVSSNCRSFQVKNKQGTRTKTEMWLHLRNQTQKSLNKKIKNKKESPNNNNDHHLKRNQ